MNLWSVRKVVLIDRNNIPALSANVHLGNHTLLRPVTHVWLAGQILIDRLYKNAFDDFSVTTQQTHIGTTHVLYTITFDRLRIRNTYRAVRIGGEKVIRVATSLITRVCNDNNPFWTRRWRSSSIAIYHRPQDGIQCALAVRVASEISLWPSRALTENNTCAT